MKKNMKTMLMVAGGGLLALAVLKPDLFKQITSQVGLDPVKPLSVPGSVYEGN